MAAPSTGPEAPLSAPSFPAFLVAYAGWATLAVSAMMLPLLGRNRGGMKGSVVILWLLPLTLLFASRWVGRSTNLGTLVKRSVAAHVLPMGVVCVLMGIVQAGSPGGSSHGGGFIFLIFFLPLLAILAAMMGLTGAFASYGVMRLLGKASR